MKSKKFVPFLFCLLLISTSKFSTASNLQSKYDVKFYFLDLEIQKASSTISGNVLIKSQSLNSNLDTIYLQLAENLILDSIVLSINNSPFQISNFSRVTNKLYILPTQSIGLNQMVDTRIYYHGNPQTSNGIAGPLSSGFFQQSNVAGANGQHKFSASPPYNSATWFPCKQDLKDKADSSWFFITTNAADRGLSNGNLTNTVDLGNGTKRWEWKSRYPIDFYLISFVVNSSLETIEYWKPEGRTDSLKLTYYGYVPTNVKNILSLYSNLFGFYPFYNEKLGIASVDLGGGIENQTMIALGSTFGGFEPHEISHMWFGDNVSCGSWKDIMLNEGMAKWCESIYAEFNSNTPNETRKTFFTDNTTVSSVYGNTMDTTTINSVFGNSALYYKKASMVINTLRFHINNDDLFFQGLRNYQTQFACKSALGTDLKAVMETTTGLDLTDFFNQWYYKGGAPTFNITWAQSNNQLYLKLNQTTNSVANPLYKTPLELKIIRTDGDTIVRLFVSDNISNFNFECPGNITGFTVDPNQWITNGNGTVTLDSTLAINNKDTNNKLHIFPNPAKQTITVSGINSNANKLEVYSANGQLIITQIVNSSNAIVNIQDLKTGMYFLKLKNDKEEIEQRFIKE
jgi:aminopeptidase N